MRLHVMAAITIADDLAEARKRIAALEAELASHRDLASAGDEQAQLLEARLAEGVSRAAERIERLARGLNASVAAQG
jgi:cell division protein ZapA